MIIVYFGDRFKLQNPKFKTYSFQQLLKFVEYFAINNTKQNRRFYLLEIRSPFTRHNSIRRFESTTFLNRALRVLVINPKLCYRFPVDIFALAHEARKKLVQQNNIS